MNLRPLLTLLAFSGALAQTLPLASAPVKLPAAAPVQVDVAAQLPNMILTARQVVLYAPALQRPDVAEAVRRALTERGTQVYLITTRPPLLTDNSFTFRLLLMQVPTYLTSGQGAPFVLIDGRGITGPGVTGPGSAVYASGSASAHLAAWAGQVTRSAKPLDAAQAVKVWVKQKYGIDLR